MEQKPLELDANELDEQDIDCESENDDHVSEPITKVQPQTSFRFGEQRLVFQGFEMHLTNSNPEQACNFFLQTLAGLNQILPIKSIPTYIQ